MTAKKCTKKRDARAKLFFCQSKPVSIAFSPFSMSLPSLSLLLQLPIVYKRVYFVKDINMTRKDEKNSKRLYRSSGKEKQIRCLVLTFWQKRELTPHFHFAVLQWRQRNVLLAVTVVVVVVAQASYSLQKSLLCKGG